MVKRYSRTLHGLIELEGGDYVLYSDYNAIAAELTAARAERQQLWLRWEAASNDALDKGVRIRELEAALRQAENWIADLQSGMYVNCVYCGHRYGPSKTTPVSMADVLKAHIENCPEHPMSKLRDALSGMIGLVQLFSHNSDIPAPVRRLMTANHRFLEALACFPGTDWNQFGIPRQSGEEG